MMQWVVVTVIFHFGGLETYHLEANWMAVPEATAQCVAYPKKDNQSGWWRFECQAKTGRFYSMDLKGVYKV